MANLPKLRRILLEDFPDQAEWISKLIEPMNQFLDSTSAALNRGLTVKENLAGDIKEIEVDGIFPIRVSWGLLARPISVLVGGVSRSDGIAYNQPRAVQVAWSFNQNRQLQIDSVVGLLPEAKAFVDGDVSTGSDTIRLPLHGFVTGDKVILATSGTLPAGLTPGNYYAVLVDSFHIKLATTFALALAGTAVDITAAAGGGSHTISPLYSNKFKLTLECKVG
jgi:hypothetical protein